MDRITNTADNALVSYFNTLRRTGGISLSERYKLILLWFFNYLKTKSYFLEYFDDDDEGIRGWKHDSELEKKVNAIFDKSIKCLSDGTCNIRLMDGDCTSLPMVTLFTQSEPVEKIQLLLLNDSEPVGDSSVNPSNMSWNNAMIDEIWTLESGFIVENAEPQDERNLHYLSYD